LGIKGLVVVVVAVGMKADRKETMNHQKDKRQKIELRYFRVLNGIEIQKQPEKLER
jgi:hypothetical protein